ncbi:hypothetical protein NKR23_g8499 [Pleurostoma richardsiae]|uniref:Uncharacterized protein n=1 Tax=Pleurostoma richardsiae TaxID=41990 RepID=A0AA38R8S3_9PEZI|nr:hypothetical protein NKR23_g8499 [Pleurostoma richardsiae]
MAPAKKGKPKSPSQQSSRRNKTSSAISPRQTRSRARKPGAEPLSEGLSHSKPKKLPAVPSPAADTVEEPCVVSQVEPRRRPAPISIIHPPALRTGVRWWAQSRAFREEEELSCHTQSFESPSYAPPTVSLPTDVRGRRGPIPLHPDPNASPSRQRRQPALPPAQSAGAPSAVDLGAAAESDPPRTRELRGATPAVEVDNSHSPTSMIKSDRAAPPRRDGDLPPGNDDDGDVGPLSDEPVSAFRAFEMFEAAAEARDQLGLDWARLLSGIPNPLGRLFF